VAANISTEQFVGMAAQAAGNVGLAVAVYVLVTTAAVLDSGATTLETVFGIPLVNGVVLIAAPAVAYSTWGGSLSLSLGSEGGAHGVR
jgi:uncharacterized membrane protein YkvI